MLASPFLQAAWKVDEQNSTVNFSSTKIVKSGQSITEGHVLSKVKGEIKDNGAFTMKIDLESVDTKIQIRNERIKKYIFNVKEQRYATISGQLNKKNLALLRSAKQGGKTVQAFTLNLNGVDVAMTGKFSVFHSTNGVVLSSEEPMILSTQALKAVKGVGELVKLAGLDKIILQIPVQLTLNLKNS